MADVTVFVDDAVLGTLPPICAKDGVPTSDRLAMQCQVGGGTGLGVAWLLVLAGPLGWLGLVVIALARRPPDWLTVKVPLCEQAYERHRSFELATRAWLAVAIIAAVLALVSYKVFAPAGTVPAVVLAVLAAAALVRGLVAWFRTTGAAVRVELDASRRWVTLSGVHPDFAKAVRPPGSLSGDRRWPSGR